MTRDGSQGRRGRRIFSAEFKQEAVRRVRERRTAGVTLAHISRELEVSADPLRAWSCELEANTAAALTDVLPGQGRLPSGAEELRRLQREVQRLQQENTVFKRCGGVLREGGAVSARCAALDVSPSGYYAAVQRAAAPPKAHTRRVQQCVDIVRTLFVHCRKRYGAPRLHRLLQARGERIAKKAVARILQAEGLTARRPASYVGTTQANPGEPVVPNRLARRFALGGFPAPNHAWVGHMTYIPTLAGWLCLAILLDLARRKIVGWAVGSTLETSLPLTARRRALAWEAPPVGLLHHTDRGGRYASLTYRDALKIDGAVANMSLTGDCWDIAVAESFFMTIEHELLAHHQFASHRDATHALTDYLQWYNAERLHSTLGSVSPMQYEGQPRHSTRAA